jgi:protein-tyrosine phosphatase
MGNICRSPTAEGVFRALAAREAPQLKVETDSAGTHDYHVGDPPDVRALRVAAARGVNLSGLRARLLTVLDFDHFDLVLVMDRQNRDAALAIAPPYRHDKVRLLLDYAPEQSLREVPDPYYGERAAFELVFELTQQAARGLLASLTDSAAQHP